MEDPKPVVLNLFRSLTNRSVDRSKSGFFRSRSCAKNLGHQELYYNTNTIEGVWGNCKNKFSNMHGTSAAHFDSYLQEWLFRRLHEDNVFGNLVFWMRHYYPV